MADDSKPSGPNLGGNAFVWVAVVAAVLAYVSGRPTLENLRPRASQLPATGTNAAQDIAARLWQDPFETVLKADGDYYGWNSAGGGNTGSTGHRCASVHDEDTHCRSPLTGDPPPQAIGIIVPGGPYSEDAEFRRRTRYAVLAALDVLGYTPKDPQHIGVFIPPTPSSQAKGPSSTVDGPRFVPYEVLNSQVVNSQVSNSQAADRPGVALFWLDEDALGDHPLGQLTSLFNTIKSATTKEYRVKILGPQGSDTLLKMLQDVAPSTGARTPSGNSSAIGTAQPTSGPAAAADAPHLDFYDYSATAAPAALCGALGAAHVCDCTQRMEGEDCFISQFKHANIGFRRALTTDDVLAIAINSELKRRGIYVGEDRAHVVLISEWDTFYGRTLPQTFARCLTTGRDPTRHRRCDENSSDDAINEKTSSWLSRYSYLRGLDGQAADASAASQTDRRATPNATTSGQNSATAGTSQNTNGRLLSDTAQGQGQGDYLQRLASELRSKDERLRNEGRPGIRVVGILGSDFYDKLLVFQAVKSALPAAFFFTTDLDQRLIHPAQEISTVNLVVASGRGLSLPRGLQKDVPPFRGSYQTAAFLATLMAACAPTSVPGKDAPVCAHPGDDQPASSWSRSAELYEIGRTRPIELPVRDAPEKDLPRDTCSGESGSPDVYECGAVTQEHRPQPPSTARVVGLALLEAGAAFALAAFLLRLAMGRPLHIAAWLAAALFAAIVAAFQLFDPALLASIDVAQLLQGVSLWPSICIQFASVAFGVAAVFYVRRSSSANLASLRERLCIDDTLRGFEATRGSRSFRLWDALPLGIRKLKGTDGSSGAPQDPTANATGAATTFYWVRYVDYVRHWWQFGRVAAFAGLGMILAGVIWLAFPSSLPTGSSVSRHLYLAVALIGSFTTLAVVFYVADITLFSRLFVREAFSHDFEAVVWTRDAKTKFAQALLRTTLQPDDDVQNKLVATTMTIAYVSERTKCITPFIYSPFIMIALSVISRSPVLGPSTLDPFVITIEAVSLIVALVSAIALRSAAEDARTETLRQLNMLKWRALTQESGAALRDRLDLLLERVKALSEGAFSPLSQQPVVRALLLPLASYGSTLLLSSFSIGG